MNSMKHWESLGRIVSPMIIRINGPNHGSSQVQKVDELSFDFKGFLVVITDPIRSVISVWSSVAIVYNDLPVARLSVRQVDKGVVIESL